GKSTTELERCLPQREVIEMHVRSPEDLACHVALDDLGLMARPLKFQMASEVWIRLTWRLRASSVMGPRSASSSGKDPFRQLVGPGQRHLSVNRTTPLDATDAVHGSGGVHLLTLARRARLRELGFGNLEAPVESEAPRMLRARWRPRADKGPRSQRSESRPA